ncbi:hypothetical protein GH714_033412 [Hevea brasiliensis]|uniref:Uncharacterized protein n=1 Tax=Hevea brasiliensis TaxID=3981 RepID=A0A6A6M6M9_HEVBR|nr:hypothetical protein GH714_033412 [Hevea brasiliensis]
MLRKETSAGTLISAQVWAELIIKSPLYFNGLVFRLVLLMVDVLQLVCIRLSLRSRGGEEERAQGLRSAALQALSSMVWFMGEHSHISLEFDNIVSVVLENYGDPTKISENLDTNKQGAQDREDAQNPIFWSWVCLNNMAQLGKGTTSIRRVLESLFRYFDCANLWSPEYGLAFPVLRDMQFLMDNSGWRCRPNLDVMAVMLENISTIAVMSRAISAVYRIPETLFHHLIPAMVQPDHEARLGAHRIFSVVLVPSSICPRQSSSNPESKKGLNLRTLSRTVGENSLATLTTDENPVSTKETSGPKDTCKMKNTFYPIGIDPNFMDLHLGFNKPRRKGIGKSSSKQFSGFISGTGEERRDIEKKVSQFEKLDYFLKLMGIYGEIYTYIRRLQDEIDCKKAELANLGCRFSKLSSLQINMLLASIWVQSISPANTPENYEAIAHTYGLVMLFSRAKVDPFLHLVNKKLKAVNAGSDHSRNIYGSKEDDDSAFKFLSEIDITGDQSREFFAAEIVKSLENVPDSELSFVNEQLLNEFLPNDVCQLGGQFMDALLQLDQDDSMVTVDEDVLVDSVEGQAKPNKELIFQNQKLLSVNQLTESVLDAAHQAGRMSITAPDLPYKEMAHHCDTLLMGKQKKISNVMSAHKKQESLISFCPKNHCEETKKIGSPFLDLNFTANSQRLSIATIPMQCATEYQHNPDFFQLPSLCPYDNFLKAAGFDHNEASENNNSSLGMYYFSGNKSGLHILSMAAKYIISAVVGSFAIAYACDQLIADKKIFGGTTPKTVASNEWWEETDKKFQAWPRTAGPPVVMNPISRQNFIVKSRDS